MYDMAIAAQPNEFVYYTNKAAALIEMSSFDTCLTFCRKVLARRQAMDAALPGGASAEKVAKAFCRMAACHERRGCFDDALVFYERAAAEANSEQIQKAIRGCLRRKA